MAVSLYEHNERAYRRAAELMEETGKAAVIHPTGTGKSFIGFKLCEENEGKKVCWLSPSETIFRTQLNNLKKVSNGYVPANIAFYTYAGLMLRSEEGIGKIGADYIILDEFHRCGAKQWGKGVHALLKTHPAARVLGLSATNVRYLDNRRDMADELFEGNITSEMSLGEAISLGILKAPKYVVSMFPCEKELKKYEARAKRAKSRAVRDKAESVLEKLRRALGNAEGLDKIFAKHLKRNGKYIAFCSDAEHMREMAEKAPEWFESFGAPRIYRVYSEEAAAARVFRAFEKDESERLKLLPSQYEEDGIWLGRWLNEQKRIYRGEVKGKTLSAEQIGRLEEIGAVWSGKSEAAWEEKYREIKAYQAGRKIEDEKKRKSLNRWLNLQKNYLKEGKLSKERAAKLKEIARASL